MRTDPKTQTETSEKTIEKTITIKTKKITILYELKVTAIARENAAFITTEIEPKKITIKEKGKEDIEEDLNPYSD